MSDDVFTAKLVLAGIIAAGTAIWGWLGWLVLLWVAAMAMDYATGTLAAIKHHEWNSAAARDGLWHKGGMILVVCVAALTDLALTLILQAGVAGTPFDECVLLTVLALAWYTLTELGSVLENAMRITNKVPPWLRRFLKNAVDRVDERAGHGEGSGDGRND
jgi:toxin secretion/phage lysis holin